MAGEPAECSTEAVMLYSYDFFPGFSLLSDLLELKIPFVLGLQSHKVALSRLPFNTVALCFLLKVTGDGDCLSFGSCRCQFLYCK